MDSERQNMAEEALQNKHEDQEAGHRERSSIQFPYLPLDEAVAIAKGVHAVGGSRCQIDQLAAHLSLKPDTGPFRLKLGTTKMFGLITYGSGSVTLTPLGSRISDPQQEQAARAEAFLNIPLYKKVYEQFKGASLPPANGLETAMVDMGVGPKQKSNARTVFQRSATQAGFFAFAPDRLVYPAIKGSVTSSPALDPAPSTNHDGNGGGGKGKNGGGNGGGGELHPFIQGLIEELPEPKSDWPFDERRKWLQAASNIFDLIYKSEDSKVALRIEVQKDSAK
jgi:hypothetical protein